MPLAASQLMLPEDEAARWETLLVQLNAPATPGMRAAAYTVIAAAMDVVLLAVLRGDRVGAAVQDPRAPVVTNQLLHEVHARALQVCDMERMVTIGSAWGEADALITSLALHWRKLQTIPSPPTTPLQAGTWAMMQLTRRHPIPSVLHRLREWACSLLGRLSRTQLRIWATSTRAEFDAQAQRVERAQCLLVVTPASVEMATAEMGALLWAMLRVAGTTVRYIGRSKQDHELELQIAGTPQMEEPDVPPLSRHEKWRRIAEQLHMHLRGDRASLYEDVLQARYPTPELRGTGAISASPSITARLRPLEERMQLERSSLCVGQAVRRTLLPQTEPAGAVGVHATVLFAHCPMWMHLMTQSPRTTGGRGGQEPRRDPVVTVDAGPQGDGPLTGYMVDEWIACMTAVHGTIADVAARAAPAPEDPWTPLAVAIYKQIEEFHHGGVEWTRASTTYMDVTARATWTMMATVVAHLAPRTRATAHATVRTIYDVWQPHSGPTPTLMHREVSMELCTAMNLLAIVQYYYDHWHDTEWGDMHLPAVETGRMSGLAWTQRELLLTRREVIVRVQRANRQVLDLVCSVAAVAEQWTARLAGWRHAPTPPPPPPLPPQQLLPPPPPPLPLARRPDRSALPGQ